MDIIILALITAFIFFKLFSSLGKIDDEQKKNILEKLKKAQEAQENKEKFNTQKEQDNPEKLKLVGNTSTKDSDSSIDNLAESEKSSVIATLSLAKTDLHQFLEGAKSAFEIILHSFSSGDKEGLKDLLSDKIYSQFEYAINERNSSGKVLVTNIIKVDPPKILSCSQEGPICFITLNFRSKQINYITNSSGEVIDGSKDAIIDVSDIWTFKKDSASEDPNWLLCATQS